MPRDTPPPIPKEILDEWYAKRRAKRNAERASEAEQRQEPEKAAAPVVEVKTVYEAQPIVRDLRKEAVSAFMPAAVRMKIEKGKGQGGLLEPEEADQLEKEGYLRSVQPALGQAEQSEHDQGAGLRQVTLEEVADEEA